MQLKRKDVGHGMKIPGEGVGRGAGTWTSLASGTPKTHSLFNKTYSFEPLKLYSFSYH